MAKTDKAEPATLVAPPTAEDPSRGFAPARAVERGFPGYPKDKFHPVFGKRTVGDPNEEAVLQPAHNWFDSAEAADAARTDREAQQVLHMNQRVKVDGALNGAVPTTMEDAAVLGDAGIVRNSVSATESLKSGHPEPL